MLYWNLYRDIHIVKEDFALVKSIIHKSNIDLNIIDLQKRWDMFVLDVAQLQKIHEKVGFTMGVSFLFWILFIIIVSSSSMPSLNLSSFLLSSFAISDILSSSFISSIFCFSSSFFIILFTCFAGLFEDCLLLSETLLAILLSISFGLLFLITVILCSFKFSCPTSFLDMWGGVWYCISLLQNNNS